ncbi:MAG: MurR/RpiR family transcriptional regulator [Veillonellaceae bacterium]|nr:MurR/RpiR family transcriptional regulator [Veillonellaceae bacterium]
MDVLKSINQAIPELSKSQKVVAYYILENWQTVAYKSARTLAEELSVSQSTILRTADQLGFVGFPALQEALQGVINERVSILSQLDLAATEEKKQGSATDEIAKVLNLHEANLQKTFRQLDAEKIKRVASILLEADRVAVVGMRSSSAVAHCLGFNLSFIRGNVQVFNSDYMLLEYIASMSPADALVVSSFSRYTMAAIEVARTAKKKQCKVVAITDNMTSPLIAIADESFIVSTTSRHINHSFVAAIAVVDAILTLMTRTGQQNARKRLTGIEEQVDSLKIFYNT